MKNQLVALFCLFTASASALEYNQNITAIFGSGNPDTGWTTAADGQGTIALRARNIETGSTANNSGYYEFSAGFGSLNQSLAQWNYEFSIAGSSSFLANHNFYLGIDLDPTDGVDYSNSLIDPLSGLFTVANGTWNSLTLFQGSLNIIDDFEVLPSTPDPNAGGVYDYRLFAVAKTILNSPNPSSGNNTFINSLPTDTESTPVLDVNIRVTVNKSTSVPDAGGTLAILGLSVAGLAGFRRRFAA